MMTSNVLQRTFYIKYGISMGTAFTLDRGDRQYLVTARHVCEGIKDKDSIFLYHENVWQSLSTTVVGLGQPSEIAADVAVLALDIQISPSYSLPATSNGLIWGQDVFFLGFPYGLHTEGAMNNGYPLPLIKRALMSGAVKDSSKRDIFLLDGHNNSGFSGGPVVFRPANNTSAPFNVMGIISAFRTEEVSITFQGKPTGLAGKANTGIIVCPSISIAVDMIDANPIGVVIEGQNSST